MEPIKSILSRLALIPQIERKRLALKGPFNCALAASLLVGIIWTATNIGRHYWPQHVEDKKTFVLVGSFIFHELFQIISFLMYLPGYFGNTTWNKYLVNKNSSRPWERKEWPEVRAKTIKNLLINQLLVYPLLIFVSTFVGGIRVRFDNFPEFSEVFLQVFIVYFIEDFFFYSGHRLFHTFKPLYKMHKVHHQYDTLYTWVTEYFHPIDFALANVMPSAMGFIILGDRAHCFVLFFWICWKVTLSQQGHSGYEFPFSPMRIFPLIMGANMHDYHHSHNVGTFAGSCYFWDLVTGTSQQYFQHFLKRESLP